MFKATRSYGAPYVSSFKPNFRRIFFKSARADEFQSLRQDLSTILKIFQVLDEVKEGLQYLFQTRNELTLALTGSGNAGLEAAFFNLIEPRDTVLIAANGFWGERAGDVAFRQG